MGDIISLAAHRRALADSTDRVNDAHNIFLARALKLSGLTPITITMKAEPVPLLGRLTEREPDYAAPPQTEG